MYQYPTLYHIDQNDNVRIWFAERDGGNYRSTSGLQDGAKVTSDWKAAEPKNVGRINETSAEVQANLEIESIYRDRLSRKYSYDLKDAKKSNFLAPMLADTWNPKKHLKKINTFFTQPKLDGIRFLASEDGGHSRSGKPIMTTAHIDRVLAQVFDNFNVTLDGELYNHDLKNDFEKLTSLINTKKPERLTPEERQEIEDKVQYHVYDCILHDRPSASVFDRQNFLDNLFVEFDFGGIVHFVEGDLIAATEKDVQKAHDRQAEKGYEGLMLRDPDSVYEHKRSKSLIKVKMWIDEEFPVVAIHEGQGNWAGKAKSVTVKVPGGTSDASMTGSMEYGQYVLEHADEFIGGDATIKFQNWTTDGKLRFATVKKLHGGKRQN